MSKGRKLIQEHHGMPPAPEGATALLIVSPSYTHCGHCGGRAFPTQLSHQTLAGPGRSGRPGCGAVFTGITTRYADITNDDLRGVRDDLPIVRKEPPP